MEQKINNKKKIVKIAIWVVIVVFVMATIHITLNYFDLFEFVRKLHGG